MQLGPQGSRDLLEVIRLERRAFAAKIRMVRAVLGWSQSEFGFRVGLTQRAIHKIEQGDTEPRRTTVRMIEEVWREEGIEFEDLPDGGFRLSVRSPLIERLAPAESRGRHAARTQLGITAIGHRLPAYRA
ncbi:MAG TPA: helix-turn-helix transcriptional regulator [Pseudolabrys sp.]|nr:helix-turn-helix transcriptional regulator [Pseudolabrys sp.]